MNTGLLMAACKPAPCDCLGDSDSYAVVTVSGSCDGDCAAAGTYEYTTSYVGPYEIPEVCIWIYRTDGMYGWQLIVQYVESTDTWLAVLLSPGFIRQHYMSLDVDGMSCSYGGELGGTFTVPGRCVSTCPPDTDCTGCTATVTITR